MECEQASRELKVEKMLKKKNANIKFRVQVNPTNSLSLTESSEFFFFLQKLIILDGVDVNAHDTPMLIN